MNKEIKKLYDFKRLKICLGTPMVSVRACKRMALRKS